MCMKVLLYWVNLCVYISDFNQKSREGDISFAGAHFVCVAWDLSGLLLLALCFRKEQLFPTEGRRQHSLS